MRRIFLILLVCCSCVAPDFEKRARAAHALLNAERAEKGMGPITWDEWRRLDFEGFDQLERDLERMRWHPEYRYR